MSNAQNVFSTLAQQDMQQQQLNTNAAQANSGNAQKVFSDLAANNGQVPKAPNPGEEMTQPGSGKLNDFAQNAANSFTQDMGIPSGEWSVGRMIQGAKQKWADAQAGRNAEAQMGEETIKHIKAGNYGQAAENLLKFLGTEAFGPGPGAVKGIVKDIGGNVVEGGKAALQGKGGEAAGHITAAGMKVLPMVLGEPEAGEEAPAAVEATGKPGLVEQVTKGAKVAQKPAKESFGGAVKATGQEPTENIRSMMNKTIGETGKAEGASYKELNTAAGVDMKDLYDYRSRLEDALDNPANIDREDLLRDKLRDVDARISHAEADSTKNLVNAPEKLKEAKGLTQKRYAQEELKKRLFNNESVVSGNAEHGAEESINVDAAIREVEKLDKPSRYAPEGSPSRLEQALGKDGAKNLKQQLYDAQKAGETALNRQKVAKWVAGIAGVGAGTEAVRHAASVFSAKQ